MSLEAPPWSPPLPAAPVPDRPADPAADLADLGRGQVRVRAAVGYFQPAGGAAVEQIATSFPHYLGWVRAEWIRDTIALLATLLVITAVGVASRRVLGQRLLRWVGAVIKRIPLASIIYDSAKKLLDMLQTEPGSTQRVVLIDFPHRDMKSVGLVTRVIKEHGTDRELAAVYVPTTPNPTSGYLEIVPVELLTPTDWTVDQAMSFIISGGAVAPSSVPFTRAGERTGERTE